MLSFHINCPSYVLSSYFDKAIDKALTEESFETHGVHLKLNRRGDSFFNMDGDVIFINTIADIEVFKDIGLFSSEIKGVIDINLVIQYDINHKFKLSTKTEILNYKWIEKPQLEVGVLNMPVGKLVELALQHYESIITAKVDAAIGQSLDINALVKHQISEINNELANNSFNGLRVVLNPKKLVVERPKYIDQEVHIKGGVVLDVNVSDMIAEENNEEPTFDWITTLDKENIILADFKVSDNFIKSLLTESVRGQNVGGKPLVFTSMNIFTNINSLDVDATISSPIEGQLSLTGTPLYIEASQQLKFENSDFSIKPEGFIYKLSAPLVNKFIEAKIDELFPIDIAELISTNLQKFLPKNIQTEIADINPQIDNVRLNKFEVDVGEVRGKISVHNPHLNISFKTSYS